MLGLSHRSRGLPPRCAGSGFPAPPAAESHAALGAAAQKCDRNEIFAQVSVTCAAVTRGNAPIRYENSLKTAGRPGLFAVHGTVALLAHCGHS